MTKYIAPHLRLGVAMPRLIDRLSRAGQLKDGLEIKLEDICAKHPLLQEALLIIKEGDLQILMQDLEYNATLMGKNMGIRYDSARRMVCFFAKQMITDKVAGEEFL